MRTTDDVARMLLEAGAVAKPSDYLELAHACAGRGHLALLRTFAREPAFTAALSDPQIIDAAIEGGDAVIVDYLLEHGATLPDTFLAKAVASGSTALVEAALRAPDAVEKCGASSDHGDAMCIAAGSGHVAVMTLLAERGVPVLPVVPGATSPLHRAAMADDAERDRVLDWFVARGIPRDRVLVDVSRCERDDGVRQTRHRSGARRTSRSR